MVAASLTRDEWRTVAIGTLTATLGALGVGLVTWGLEEGKRILAEKRKPPEPPRVTLT